VGKRTIARVREAKTGKELLTIFCGKDESLRTVVFSPDGTRIAASRGNTVTIGEIADTRR
jgi:hypothetical protein